MKSPIPQVQAHDFVIVCKSYLGDLRRAERMMTSLAQHNHTNIPVFMVVPAKDLATFQNALHNHTCHWLTDEAITVAHPLCHQLLDRYATLLGSLSQQIIKSEAWRLIPCKAYLCVDSDTIFTKPFTQRDFCSANGTPYTLIQQAKDLYQLAINRGQRRSYQDHQRLSQSVRDQFGRDGPLYEFLPQPLIWSTQVWQDLDTQWLAPQNMTLWDAIERCPSEAHWYGEALLHLQSIPLIPIEPLFRVYHFDWQYDLMRKWGETHDKLSAQYLGVCLQSNWEVDMDALGTRDWTSKMVRRVKRWIKLKL
jgi:Family of unknown function (DUF6492)